MTYRVTEPELGTGLLDGLRRARDESALRAAAYDAAVEIERLRAERDLWEARAMEYGARLARVMSEKIVVDEQQSAREELTRQAQELDMGYGQFPVSLAEMRKPEERAKNERGAAALDAIAAYGQPSDL